MKHMGLWPFWDSVKVTLIKGVSSFISDLQLESLEDEKVTIWITSGYPIDIQITPADTIFQELQKSHGLKHQPSGGVTGCVSWLVNLPPCEVPPLEMKP